MMGKDAEKRLDKALKDGDVSILTKRRIIESTVFTILIHGSERWTVRKENTGKDAFEQ